MRQFREHVSLEPVDESAAQLHVDAVQLRRVRATTHAISRFQQEDPAAGMAQSTGGSEARQPATNDDDVLLIFGHVSTSRVRASRHRQRQRYPLSSA